jgi:hypothetical protein
MRFGMKELLSDLTTHIRTTSDQETLELGILALIEKENAKRLIKCSKSFQKITSYHFK